MILNESISTLRHEIVKQDRMRFELFVTSPRNECHFWLACHAAFAVALTSDLLYKIFINFQFDCNGKLIYQDIDGTAGNETPFWTVPELLYSPIVNELGHDLYEIYPSVREKLLDYLKKHPDFGSKRILELANFMKDYLYYCSEKIPTRSFETAQILNYEFYLLPPEEFEKKIYFLLVESKSKSKKLYSDASSVNVEYLLKVGKKKVAQCNNLSTAYTTNMLEALLNLTESQLQFKNNTYDENSLRKFSTAFKQFEKVRDGGYTVKLPLELQSKLLAQQPVQVFIAYSNSDEVFLNTLQIHLTPLVQSRQLEICHIKDVHSDKDWDAAMSDHLHMADIIIMLVSPEFIHSDYINRGEILHSFNGFDKDEGVLMPIIVESIDWNLVPLKRNQCFPNDGIPISRSDNEEAFSLIVANISKKIFDIHKSSSKIRDLIKYQTGNNLPPRSYVKLVGRDEILQTVFDLLDSSYPVVIIEGLAGIGKTSVAIEVGYLSLQPSIGTKAEHYSYDYVVWVSTDDKPGQRYWLNEVLNEIARVMDFMSITQITEADLAVKKEQIMKLMQAKKMLLIIDNFDLIQDIRLEEWLTQIPHPSKALVTSRRLNLGNAIKINLEGLNEEQTIVLIRQTANETDLKEIENASYKKLSNLARITRGNPKAIELAIGHVKGGTLTLDAVIDQLLNSGYTNDDIEKLIEYFHTELWKGSSEDSQRILLIVPLFMGDCSISREALYVVSDLTLNDFKVALQQLCNRKLLEMNDGNDRIIVHPITREFARAKLAADLLLEQNARNAWCEYYLNYVKNHVIRSSPDERYWNALVNDGMKKIDTEWLSINEVLKWACENNKDRLIIDFVMALVHYMDSRFLNQERIQYVVKAIDSAKKLGLKYQEALLRIDALGWTFVEEDKLPDAYDQIMKGYNIADKIERRNGSAKDLIALTWTWRARAKAEENKLEPASKEIQKASFYKTMNKRKPWVLWRILMVEGDIFLKKKEYKRALICFQEAKQEMNKYGGEGHDYQINPRLGLTYLALNNLNEAEKKFNALREHEDISIGKLYGDYGIALVKLKREDSRQAHRLLESTMKNILKKTNTNILLKLIEEVATKVMDNINQVVYS